MKTRNIEEVEDKKVSWIELFNDLIFVVAIASADHWFLEIEEGHNQILNIIIKYLLMIIPMWWAWSGQTMLMNRFGDLIKNIRYYMFVQMGFIILMTASFNLDFDKTYLTFILGYAGIRLVTIIQYLVVYKTSKDVEIKNVALTLGRGMSISLAIALISLLFPSPYRYYIMYVGMFIDIVKPLTKKAHLNKVPVNLGHLLERVGLLVMIAFGEAIVSIVTLLSEHTSEVNYLIYSLVAFLMLVVLWSGYFMKADVITDKRIQSDGQVIVYGNLILVVSIMIIAAAIDMGSLTVLEEGTLELLSFLLGLSFITFITVKHFIFKAYLHEDYTFSNKAYYIVLCSIILITALMYITSTNMVINMFLLTIIAYADNRLSYKVTK
ncbi:low temperature requirement protein A [Mycoplasma sp. P36-A1]|uniref:low temperature requirement protein A n=1 Tax=Mycoplasma sp. P36-A1 TaxID=3252900 RepID=UPI003C308FCC